MVQSRELRVGLLVGRDLIVRRQPHLVAIALAGQISPAFFGIVAIAHRGAADVGDSADVLACRDPCRDLEQRLLAHAVDEDIGRTVDQDRMADAIAPVIVVRKAPQRGFDAADHDRDVGKEPLELASVNRRGVVGPLSRRRVRRVRIARPPFLARGVVVDHRIHVAAGNAEEEPRPPAGEKVFETAGVVPTGLGNDPHLVPSGSEQAADQRHAERGMIDVRVSIDQDDVELLPAARFRLLERDRQVRLGPGARRGLRFAARADVDEAGHGRVLITAGPM